MKISLKFVRVQGIVFPIDCDRKREVDSQSLSLFRYIARSNYIIECVTADNREKPEKIERETTKK